MKTRSLGRHFVIFTIALTTFFLGCQQKNSAAKQTDIRLPPAELIRSNFSAADFVLSLKPDSLEIVKTIFADDGAPGYVIVAVAGKVKDCYQGNLPVGKLIRYRFMAEFEKNLLENWRQKERLLVFLKRDEKSGELRAIEFGQFEETPGLLDILAKVQKLRQD